MLDYHEIINNRFDFLAYVIIIVGAFFSDYFNLKKENSKLSTEIFELKQSQNERIKELRKENEELRYKLFKLEKHEQEQ